MKITKKPVKKSAPKTRIVYKAVVLDKNDTSRYLSAYKWFNPATYKVGEVTKPTFGKLFAFSTLKQATSYAGGFKHIFRAKATGVTKATKDILHSNTTDDVYRNYWEGKGVKADKQVPPNGTVLCDTIELVKEIKTLILPS